MADTYTSNARLRKPATADRNWDAALNADLDTLDALSPVGGLVVTTTETPSTTLNVRVAAGSYQLANGTVGSFAGANPVAVGASATTLLWLTDAGTIATGSAWPSGNVVRLASVVAGASTITSVTDARVAIRSGGQALGGTPNQVIATLNAGTGVTTLSAPQDLAAASSPTFAILTLSGLKITAASGRIGTATLAAGTVTVSTAAVTSASLIFAVIQSPGGTVGSVYVSAKVVGTSFTLTSTSGSDTSVVAWVILEPG